jgi:CRISPR-associated protein Csc3
MWWFQSPYNCVKRGKTMPLRKRTVTQEESEPVSDEESLPEDLGLEEPEAEVEQSVAPHMAEEPLFATLLRHAVAKLWPGDAVMADFVTHVAGPLSALLGTRAAKGGNFVAKREQAGLNVEGDYRHDQSFRAHLINGLLPTLHIAQLLTRWEAPRLRYLHDRPRRLFMAGYILHDWLKFPDIEAELQAAGLAHDTVNANQHLPLVEALFRRWCAQLGLEAFLRPEGGSEAALHDLIYIASNTQVKWGTLRNLSALPRLSLDGRTLDLCESLSRLADLITYVARTPRQVVVHHGIRREIAALSNNTAHLRYHHVADNRGVLTNLIHNAALQVMSHSLCAPILYAPSGVVYLAHQDAPPMPDVATIADTSVERVQHVAAERLRRSLAGFGRDGKGLKRADYHDLFFTLSDQVRLASQAAFQWIPPTKAPKAGNRFAKMRDGQWLDPSVDLDLPDDIRVDQLAEWCYYTTDTLIASKAPTVDATSFLLDALGLSDIRPLFDAIPRDNRAGGVGYHWYFAVGYYLKRNPGKAPAEWQELVENLAERLATQLEDVPAAAVEDSWQELRAYVQHIIALGPLGEPAETDRSLFTAELAHYQNAKRTGRGRTAVCSLCSSPFEATKQQEAAILFSPMVYSNKMPLHGSAAIRDICPICGLEMMLRQLLMNRSNATGRRFEGRQIRYLYFYPTYFFSPETLEIFREVHDRLRRISFVELRRQLVVSSDQNGESVLHLDATTLQQLEPLLLSAEDLSSSADDRYVRMHFPKYEPVTFYFLGIPPASRDAKDAEAWIHPAFLALLLPVCLDVKVVASTSPAPLLREANEMTETVFLDGVHPFARYLVGQERINIDQVLSCLQRLIVGYLIHLDAHSRRTQGRWDYRWSDLPPLARDLATDPAYACHYLKKWQRYAGRDALPANKAHQYLQYTTYFEAGGPTMSHARTLVELSRQFYRARGFSSNSILRPLSVVARAILTADRRLFDREGLEEVARGELQAFMERVKNRQADGLLSPRHATESPQEAAQRREASMQRFVEYFVCTIFYDALRGDAAALRGRQLNLLKNTYETLYRDAAAQDYKRADIAEDAEESAANETAEA